MQKINPFLWFDKEAAEATKLYSKIFSGSGHTVGQEIENTPSGNVQMLSLDLFGQTFQLMSAGPLFKFNPSISFMVFCPTAAEVDKYWSELSVGGQPLMEIGEYPFSKRFGWIQDKFGLSWQIMLTQPEQIKQKIVPTLMFTGKVAGQAEEAIAFYRSIFHNTSLGEVMRYGKGEGPDREGSVKHATFTLEGQYFAAMDSAHPHGFAFNEAISFVVHCKDQQEIDYYWEKLSAVPEAEQCGWLKDKYGVSWQIVPDDMEEMMSKGTKEQMQRVTQAFLQMKKFDLAKLKQAYEGKV